MAASEDIMKAIRENVQESMQEEVKYAKPYSEDIITNYLLLKILDKLEMILIKIESIEDNA